MKKAFKISITICLLLICISCQKKPYPVQGRWACIQSGAIYDFSEKTFVLSTSVLNSAVMVRGTYRCKKNMLVTKSEELSFDFGETWIKNDGQLIPSKDTESTLTFDEEGKMFLADMEYVKF